MTKQIKAQNTLDDTFATFFAPTEETHGTGAVTRAVGEILTEVIVDTDERAAFIAERRAQADDRNTEFDAYCQAEARYHAEEK